MPDRFPSVWTQHISTEANRKEFEGTVRNSTAVLGRLKKILEERISSIEKVELDEEFYEKPNVSHRQTFNAARIKELQTIISLLP